MRRILFLIAILFSINANAQYMAALDAVNSGARSIGVFAGDGMVNLHFLDTATSKTLFPTKLANRIARQNGRLYIYSVNQFVLLDSVSGGGSSFDSTQYVKYRDSTIKYATPTQLLGKENSITPGTTSQYWRGDKTFQTLDKTAVGLSNVDNTSDATKNAASVTLTNKSISGSANTISNIANSSLLYSVITIGSTIIPLGSTATTLGGLSGLTSTVFTGNLTGNASGTASTITGNISESQVTNLVTDLAGKQATLVSGTNIKTVGGTSLLGSGDVPIPSADSSIYQTKYRSDTARNNTYNAISLKLNIADTGSMLSTYYDYRDTGRSSANVVTGGTLNKVRDSLNNLNSSNVKYADTSAMLTNYFNATRLASSSYLDQSGSKIYGTTTSSINAYSLTLTPALTAYAAGQMFNVKFNSANISAATLNINSLGAKSLVKYTSTPLVANDIVTNIQYQVLYDGTNFLVKDIGFAGQNTSSNFLGSITDESGTGVLATTISPSIATPLLTGLSSGTANDSVLVSDATTGAVRRRNSNSFAGSTSGWSLTGNAGTSISTNFFGTTDGVGLIGRVNNLASFFIDAAGSFNVDVGYQTATRAVSMGNYNTVVGGNAGLSATSITNTILFGTSAGNNQVSGDHNACLSAGGMLPNTTGSNQLNLNNAVFGVNCSGTGTTPAGQIGIGTNSPNVNAQLNTSSITNADIYFTPKTTSQINAIATPQAGFMAYNSDINGLEIYNGINWTGGIVVSSASTLTLSVGTDYIFTGTATVYTLPAVSTTTIGRMNQITIKNRGTGTITLNSASGSTIYSTTALSTYAIAAGGSLTLMPDPNYFNVE